MNSSAHRIESRFISQTYKYDDANRLIGSNGNMSQEYSTALPYGYQSSYKYTLAGRLLNKYVDSKRLSTAMGQHQVRYDNEYSYTHPDNPYAVTHILDAYGAHYDFDWDANGNLTDSRAHATHTGRFLYWTEDNRMHAAVDSKYCSYYAYDHAGGSCGSREQSQACLSYAEMEQRRRSQRRLKLTGDNNLLDVNADFMATYTILNEPTLYPSAYMVLTNKGYTNVAKASAEQARLLCRGEAASRDVSTIMPARIVWPHAWAAEDWMP